MPLGATYEFEAHTRQYGERNQNDADHRVVAATRLDTLPERWGCRRDYDSGCIELVGPGADFLSYSVHVGREITKNESYRHMQRARNEVPGGHPREWNYTSMPDGFFGDDNIRNRLPETEAGG